LGFAGIKNAFSFEAVIAIFLIFSVNRLGIFGWGSVAIVFFIASRISLFHRFGINYGGSGRGFGVFHWSFLR